MPLGRSRRLRVEGYAREQITKDGGHVPLHGITEKILRGYALKDIRVTEESLKGYALKDTHVNGLQRKISKVMR